MAFRTVIVETHSKLEYSLGYLIFRTPDATKRILLDDVHTVIINSTAVSITSALLVELSERKIKVIFCDAKHNPHSEVIPCNGNNLSPKRIRLQIHWNKMIAEDCWARIIREKIQSQARNLEIGGKAEEAKMLFTYADEVRPGDPTNREGHAAKVYFNAVFFPGFTREKDCFVNAALNYGYSIILSEINRCVVASGYLTQLGIHHKNEFNEFNLSCDLMEPLRPLVDLTAKAIKEDADFKVSMIGLLSREVRIEGKRQSLINALSIYVNSFFEGMEKEDSSKISFIDYGQ